MKQQTAPSEGRSERPPDHSVRAEISREMVRLYKDQFGRGPTKVRTDFASPDIVVCTLECSMTPAERKLAALGQHQRLRDTRLYFQHATEEDFRSIIERALSRRVRGFVSGMDTQSDISAELFYLEPEGTSAAAGG